MLGLQLLIQGSWKYPVKCRHVTDSLKWGLTSGAVLQGFRAPVCGLTAIAVNRGLQARVDDDSKNVGWLMCADPRRGLLCALLD